MKVTALILQSWFDIAIRYTGSATNAFAIAFDNGFSVTDDIAPGQTILIKDSIPISNKEVSFFTSKEIIPATGINSIDLEIISPPLGIGEMRIGSTFIVR
ncbi:hypothetical protein [Flavobacterium sp. UMI-01]|uniref:hypothetical protein n=1 Tax=Flavobacterium sp. UMI-01 TaxID=1441053 RepID=UPI001C7DEE41|nr:hypothetical protein [Flavobacterium sp. UMI-01]GIZ10291.1 hypothetical protein FUMI01_30150 [Flavobacterium sp. UMI-01]